MAATGRRSALLAAWATAFAQGRVDAQTAVDAVCAGDEPHRVEQLDRGADLLALFTELRIRGAQGLRLVLPVPGDPRGLAGPGPFTDAALAAGEAVRMQAGPGRPGFGAVPVIARHGTEVDGYAVTVVWRTFPVEVAGPDPAGAGRQAERELGEAIRAATATMIRLDAARLAPEAAQALERLRNQRGLPLPAGFDPAARSLLAQAERLAAIVELAAADDGAAVDRATTTHRRELLRELAAAARRARCAAVNAPLDRLQER
jgi:hypothetical protein